MRKFIINFFANSCAFYVAQTFLGILICDNYTILLAGAFVLALVNMIIRPVLMLISLPVNIITFGIFILIINTWMVMLADYFVAGFYINGFWRAFIVSLIVVGFVAFFRILFKKPKCSNN